MQKLHVLPVMQTFHKTRWYAKNAHIDFVKIVLEIIDDIVSFKNYRLKTLIFTIKGCYFSIDYLKHIKILICTLKM